MGAGRYRIKVIGELDATQIRKELADISKTPFKVNGALGGMGASADKATKGFRQDKQNPIKNQWCFRWNGGKC